MDEANMTVQLQTLLSNPQGLGGILAQSVQACNYKG